MLIFALIGAILFYAAVYIVWEMSHSRMNTAESWLHAINGLAVMPDNLIFIILRGLILVAALYVFADWIKTLAKKTKIKQEKRLKKESKHRVSWKKPPLS